MKESKENYVPLSQETFVLVAGLKAKLFPGHEHQMLDLLAKLRPGDIVHGFRSSFADWAPETRLSARAARNGSGSVSGRFG
jgi:hypothetical protein